MIIESEIMGDKLTKQDIEKIEEEIEQRKLYKRPELIDAVKEARAQGDLSDNFEYYAAKREKNQNEGRIKYLERMVRFADVIEDRFGDDEAGINKLVEVFFEADNETEIYKIVTPIRGKSLAGRVSIESPIGKAIMGHKAGDRVFVKIGTDSGYYIVIKSIKADISEDDIRPF